MPIQSPELLNVLMSKLNEKNIMRLQTASKNMKVTSTRHLPLLKRLSIDLKREKAKLKNEHLAYQAKEMSKYRSRIRNSLIDSTVSDLAYHLRGYKLNEPKSHEDMRRDIVKAFNSQPSKRVEAMLRDHYDDNPEFAKHRRHISSRLDTVWDERKGWYSKKTIAIENRIKKLTDGK